MNRPHLFTFLASRSSKNVRAAAWPLIDQAVVSLGNFLVNVFLARSLSLADYGALALLQGGLLALQLLNSSLISYPLSVRRPTCDSGRGAQLIGVSLLLVLALSLVLSAGLLVALLVLGRGDLALPAVTYFVFWQVQETLRRGLLAELRHRAALPGDGISYLGQFLLVALLSARGSLSPATALYAMGATSGLAALIQWRQLSIRLGGPQSVKDIVRDFSSIGGWALGNNILFTLRGLISSWTLAFTYGAVSVGLLQAALNVIFVVNPIILGLWSIIPQSVALARKGDDIAAWQAARGLGSVGAIPVGLFYVLVLTFSETILSIFYGSNSYSAEISTAVRILAVAGMMNYMAEVVSAYLYGVGAPKKALVLNGISTGSHALCAVPLVITHGLEGACIATVLAGAVRLAGTPWILRKTIRRSINTFSI